MELDGLLEGELEAREVAGASLVGRGVGWEGKGMVMR